MTVGKHDYIKNKVALKLAKANLEGALTMLDGVDLDVGLARSDIESALRDIEDNIEILDS